MKLNREEVIDDVVLFHDCRFKVRKGDMYWEQFDPLLRNSSVLYIKCVGDNVLIFLHFNLNHLTSKIEPTILAFDTNVYI